MFSGNKNCRKRLRWAVFVWGICFLSSSSAKFQSYLIPGENRKNADLEDVPTAQEVDLSENNINRETPVLELPVDDCGSKFAEVTRLVLSPPCEGEVGGGKPCVLRRGEDYYLNGTVFPKIFTKNVTLQINQVDPNFGFDTQLHPPKTACGRFGVECPVEANIPIDTLYTGRFPPSMPPFKVIVRIILYADDNAVLVCKQIPLVIT